MDIKVIPIGNSAGIILPQKLREKKNINIGDTLILNEKAEDLQFTPAKKNSDSGVNLTFAKTVDEFMKEHEDVLRELATR